MRNLFVFIFSFILVFSSSCAVKKLVVHQFDSHENIPTKTSPFLKGDIFSAPSETCAFGEKNRQFTDHLSSFIVQVSKPKFSGPFSAIELFTKTNIPYPPNWLVFKSKSYSFSTDASRLYLKFGRIIYYD